MPKPEGMMNDELSGVRAVICDVYGTLLQVGPPPENAAELWESGCRKLCLTPVPLATFNARCAARIAAENSAVAAEGEPFPDQDWVEIVLQEWRELNCLEVKPVLEICRLHPACVRTCTAMPGSIAVLERLHGEGILLGIASNAQTYTISEIHTAGIPFGVFEDCLIFLSGAFGYAKPSPRVFAHLTKKLAALGIAPHETLMVGDSLEKDIVPAAAAGWRTWHIGPRTWEALNDEIRRSKPEGMTKSE
jgi:FMN phosphatase YigB (HAD superfamily)